MSAPSRELAQLIRRAEQLALDKDWGDEAITANTRILELNPGVAAACTRLARCRLYQGRSEDAERLYRRALQLEPENRIARNHLDELMRLSKHRQIANSIPSFEEAFERGVEERRRHNSELAAVILERAYRLQPSDHCLVALAAAYRDIKKLDEAEAMYRAILKRGHNKAAMVGLAAVLRDRAELQEAEELDKEVLRLYPDDFHAGWGLKGIRADKRKPPWQRG